MAQEEIPPNVRAFLNDHVESVVQVEVLLLLYAEPARAFSPTDVASALRIEPGWAEAQLSNLGTRGMLAEAGAGAYRWAPRTADLEAAVAGLAKSYVDRRVTVIGLIYAKPTDPLRSFADAFRIRKDKDHG